MKITLDPYMLRTLPLEDYFRGIADAGYRYVEFSQRDDFWPYYTHPTANDDQVQRVKKLLKDTGTELASCLPLYRWSSPDEDERQAAVRYWMRAIDITVELGCDQMNSEFSGRPEQRERCEGQFWKSLDVILPRLEKEGIKLNIEPHPDDFIEDGIQAVNMIRAINSDNVGFLYCVSHSYHQGHTMREVMTHAGSLLRHLHISDTFNHLASNGDRYILNPQGTQARVHQHLEPGDGEVDFDDFFQILDDLKFDGIATMSMFSQTEKTMPAFIRTRELLQNRFPQAAV
jgi:myo-inositol catabolism protein IolH